MVRLLALLLFALAGSCLCNPSFLHLLGPSRARSVCVPQPIDFITQEQLNKDVHIAREINGVRFTAH
jgi:hypothetical protein